MLEAFIIIFSGLILGLGITLLMIPLIVAASQDMLADALYLTSSAFMSAFLIGVLVSFVSSFMPARQALKLKVVDALAKG
jgi:ABC-type antimicrobial peptide transport system permease subunit